MNKFRRLINLDKTDSTEQQGLTRSKYAQTEQLVEKTGSVQKV